MNNVITINDKDYPKLLKEIGKEAPKQIYWKGNWNDIFTNCLAVVGSRQMTSYGKRVVEQIVTEVAAAGITIVSGFMYGVDAASHKAALSAANGRTIVVMPCGIDLIHPEYQQDLYSEILNNNGLVISEYEGAMQPSNWTYPRRNRIVAGLAKATLVIEAGEKSGSLITANWAKKFKRKIFVVPGPITSENSKGIMELLKEGASPVSSVKDILDYYGIIGHAMSNGDKTSHVQQTGLENQIIAKLRNEALGADELARTFGVSAASLGVTLSLMQLRGLIQQDGPKYYID